MDLTYVAIQTRVHQRRGTKKSPWETRSKVYTTTAFESSSRLRAKDKVIEILEREKKERLESDYIPKQHQVTNWHGNLLFGDLESVTLERLDRCLSRVILVEIGIYQLFPG